MARSTKLIGPIAGSTPTVQTGGTGTASDKYAVKVTTAGISGVAKVTITSREDDGVAAQTVTSGTPLDLGTGGGTITFVFDYLHLGDGWTVEVDSGGPVGKAVPLTTNWGGEYREARVGTDGALLVRGLPTADKLTIADGASVSGTAFEYAGCAGLLLRMPEAWTTADIAFQAALWPGGTFQYVKDGFGNYVTVSVEAGADIAVTGTALEALKAAFWVKLVSVDSSDPTSQVSQSGGDRNIIVCKAG